MKKIKTIFRYPGGKSKIAADIIKDVIVYRPQVFIDVFAGGGSVFIESLNNLPNTKVIINDLDTYIYSFWYTLCKGESYKLISIINQYGMPTVPIFNELRGLSSSDINNLSTELKAFMGLFFNRTTFSGIFRSGPIGGYTQNGPYKIDCRYNIDTIVKRITALEQALLNNKAECYNLGFMDIIKEYSNCDNAFMYLDPPYIKQGNQLYNIAMTYQEFVDMAEALKTAKCHWIISHAYCKEFVDLFCGWSYVTDTKNIPYTINSIKDNRTKEILISNRDFCFNKRSVGRPKTTNNIYSLTCCVCYENKKTNPISFNKYCSRKRLHSVVAKNNYVCRRCRTVLRSI